MDFFTFINTYQYSFVPALIAFIIISVIAIYLGIIFWVARDITTRSKNILAIIGSIILVILLNIIGLSFYLLVRPNKTLSENINYLGFSVVENPNLINCISCSEVIRHEYNNCPYCGVQQNLICPDCGVRHNPTWNFCQECGHDFVPKKQNIFGKLFGGIKTAALFPFVIIARAFRFIFSKLPKFKIRFVRLPQLPTIKFSFKRPSFRRSTAKVALLGAETVEAKENIIQSKKDKKAKNTDKKEFVVAAEQSDSSSTKPVKFNKDGTPRKARADAGRTRGRYKARQA